MPVKRHSRNSGVPIIWGLSKFSLVMMVCGRKIKGLNFLNFLFNLWLNIFRIKFFNILIVFILSFWNIFFQLQRHYFLRQVFSNHTLIFWSTWLCQNDLQIACRQENLAQSFGNLPIHWYFLFLWIPPSSSSFSVKTFLHLQWRQRLKVELIFLKDWILCYLCKILYRVSTKISFIMWRLTLRILIIKRQTKDEWVTVAVIAFGKFWSNIHCPRKFFWSTEHWSDSISINIWFSFFVTHELWIGILIIVEFEPRS